MNAPLNMPMYRSHKEVWALKIKSIVRDGEGENRDSDGSANITPEEVGYEGGFRVDADYMDKHKPQVGGYYVVYEDGYKSFSPATAFEKGNTLISGFVPFGQAVEAAKSGKGMRHVEKALNKLKEQDPTRGFGSFIEIENTEDVKGVAPIVKFTIQSGTVGEVGVNGVQALDMLEYVKYLFQSLNDAFPCRENALTITKIEEAAHWQEARTKDRLSRKVEGQNKA